MGRATYQEMAAYWAAVMPLELIEARSFECGVVAHVYRPRSR